MTSFRQAAAEVRACLENSSALGEWPVVRLLALLEAEDPVPVPRATLERLLHHSARCATVYATQNPMHGPCDCGVAELAALLNKERSP
jgi:hypothetical protein